MAQVIFLTLIEKQSSPKVTYTKAKSCCIMGETDNHPYYHVRFYLHVRIWLLYFIQGLSKKKKITVELLKII